MPTRFLDKWFLHLYDDPTPIEKFRLIKSYLFVELTEFVARLYRYQTATYDMGQSVMTYSYEYGVCMTRR